jgi:hypothetical protein
VAAAPRNPPRLLDEIALVNGSVPSALKALVLRAVFALKAQVLRAVVDRPAVMKIARRNLDQKERYMTDAIHDAIHGMFSDPKFKPFSSHSICHPNSLYHNDVEKIGVLVVWRSMKGNDFALGKSGLDRILQAEKDGRIDCGYVVLAEQKNGERTVVAFETAQKVQAIVSKFVAHNGNFGKYWWLTPEAFQEGEPPF